jgi:hypothetical protein
LEGVLKNRKLTKRRIEMIACFKKISIRQSILAVMLAIALGAATLTNAQQTSATSNLNAMVAQIDIDNAKIDDVIQLFGNPARYIWGEEIIAPEDLQKRKTYVIDYGGGFHILMVKGQIMELRFEHNPQYIYQGRLRVGDSIEDALRVMGAPSETVAGEKLTFKDGVLYRDIDGQKGYCYYHRSDQRLRLFFANDKVTAIYVTRSDYRG